MDFPVAMADDYFKRSELDEKRADTLNVRVPKSLKTQLEELAQFLTDKDRVANKEARGTSVGDVVVRLLKAGVEGAYLQAELPSKPTKQEIAEYLESLKSSN